MAVYDFGSISLEQLGNIKITSGKHKGSTVAEAWDGDRSYVSWCSNRVDTLGGSIKALVTYDLRKKFGAGMPPLTLPVANANMISAASVAVQRAVIESLQEADEKGLKGRVAFLERQLALVASQHEQLAIAVQAAQDAIDVILPTWLDEER